jgi:hypothetical protein
VLIAPTPPTRRMSANIGHLQAGAAQRDDRAAGEQVPGEDARRQRRGEQHREPPPAMPSAGTGPSRR